MNFNWMKKQVDNSYSSALRIIGWIYIVLGAIGAVVLGNTFPGYYYDFNFLVFFATLFGVGLFGALVLGLAEIIRLLNDNRRLLATVVGKDLDSNGNYNFDTIDELPEL